MKSEEKRRVRDEIKEKDMNRRNQQNRAWNEIMVRKKSKEWKCGKRRVRNETVEKGERKGNNIKE